MTLLVAGKTFDLYPPGPGALTFQLQMITSLQNPKIKNIVKLQEKAAERRKQQLIVIEGAREAGLAVRAGWEAAALYYEPGLYQPAPSLVPGGCPSFEVSREVFGKIAYRENSDGLILLARPRYRKAEELELPSNPFIIILEAVEKPGNLGAVLRTADAAGADAVIVCDPKTDIYNPNVIRSSVGCIFTVPLASGTSAGVIDWLKASGIRSYAAALSARKYYHQTDFRSACAVVMGTEATGLSSTWLKAADEQIKIPMQGKIDSLNVSTSCAVITFEAMRQRRFSGAGQP